jgi:hypothetical protein
MKKIIFVVFVIVTFTSCRKEWDNYIDISATGIHKPQCPNAPQVNNNVHN